MSNPELIIIGIFVFVSAIISVAVIIANRYDTKIANEYNANLLIRRKRLAEFRARAEKANMVAELKTVGGEVMIEYKLENAKFPVSVNFEWIDLMSYIAGKLDGLENKS